MTPTVAGLLAASSVVAFVVAVGTRSEARVLALYRENAVAARRSTIGRLGQRVTSSRMARRLCRTERLATSIAAARASYSLSEVIAAKLVGAVAAGIAVMLLMGPAAAPLGAIVAGGAFFIPDLVVTRAARNRRRAADAEVTQFLDLLAAASSAGLAAPGAIRRASAAVRGPLGEELEAAAASVEVGGRWREELMRVADGLSLPDLRAAVVVIVRTETLGSSLADSLRDLAADVRGARRARAAERARTAPVKMLFPLVFMVLPAFLLLTVVPVLIATVRSL